MAFDNSSDFLLLQAPAIEIDENYEEHKSLLENITPYFFGERAEPHLTRLVEILKKHNSSVTSVCVAQRPILGKRSVIWPVEASDGSRYCYKIPGYWCKQPWGEYQTMMTTSEARGMHYLPANHQVPVPYVYSYRGEPVETAAIPWPYILMEWVGGCSLAKMWNSTDMSSEELHDRRMRWLKSIANIMCRLGSTEVGAGGVPSFDSYCQFTRISPQRVATLGQEAKDPVFFAYDTHEDFFKRQLNHWTDNGSRLLGRDYGFYNCLVELVTEELGLNQNLFGLSHPRMELKHFFVNDQDKIVGMIGWHDMLSLPEGLGSIRYPRWLLPECGYALPRNPTDSAHEDKTTLDYWRSVYDSAIYEASGKSQHVTNLLRRSLVYGALWMAAKDSALTTKICQDIFEKMRGRMPLAMAAELTYEELALDWWEAILEEEVIFHLETSMGKLLGMTLVKDDTC